MDLDWDIENKTYQAVFNAALSGICANPNFFGYAMQNQPEAAVAFAHEAVLAAIHGPAYVPVHKRNQPSSEPGEALSEVPF